MTIDELGAKIAEYKKSLNGKKGKMVVFGEGGPANMDLIDALFNTIAEQERRIAELEGRSAGSPPTTRPVTPHIDVGNQVTIPSRKSTSPASGATE